VGADSPLLIVFTTGNENACVFDVEEIIKRLSENSKYPENPLLKPPCKS
jgi:hypothetical protein